MKNFVYPILIITLLLFILIINLLKPRKAIENFNASGPCEKNGKTGTCYIMSDGSQECVVADDVTPQQGITLQPKEKKKPPVKKSPPTCNQIRNYQKTATLVASDCIIQSTGETGIIFPRLGNRCVSRALVEKCKKRKKTAPASVTRRSTKAGGEPPVGRQIPKKTKPVKCAENSTKCHDPKDLQFFEDECNKIGPDWGLWKFQNCNCPKGEKSGVCRKGYHYGAFIENDSSSCVFDYSDMNRVCNDEMRFKNKNESINYGFKSITKKGCPINKQRAICNGNYYSGDELIRNATDCYPSNTDFDRKCKDLLGNNAAVKQYSSYNCVPGKIRAVCHKV